ncbi:MAG TPA: NYN domain-containing protein [Dehalococcoidia bacterium]|nr:NYN domain-containing protein [Dehalococcoidia bacterium]
MRRRPAAKDGGEDDAPRRTPARRRSSAASRSSDEKPADEKPRATTRRRSSAASRSADEKPADEKPRATTRRRSSAASRSADEKPAEEKPRTTTRRRSSAAATTETEAPAEEQAAPRQPRRRSTAAAAAPAGDVAALQTELAAVKSTLEELSGRITQSTDWPKLGVFVDVPNVLYGAEGLEDKLNMGKLLDHLAVGRDLVRATAYSPVSDNPSEPVERQRFVAPFVPHAYRIVTKPLKRFQDGSIKGNFDVEMAVDMVTMAERLDVIAVVSGDADFARLVEVIQGRGVRVEVVAFAGSTSVEMRSLADRYVELGSIFDQISD